MKITSNVPSLTPAQIRRMLRGLPRADGYDLFVDPLRYRRQPHLAARAEFDDHRITLQLPDPFLPFGEIVYYAARRTRARGIRFVWLSAGVTFTRPREVLRFLYCHEWLHWYIKERLGRKSQAETACDRFALRNYKRARVTLADAEAALRPRSHRAEAFPARRTA